MVHRDVIATAITASAGGIIFAITKLTPWYADATCTN
jgi:hypothetical protein